MVGLPGRGKSSILNTLISGDPYSNKFKAAASRKAVTTEVSWKEAQIFGTDSPAFKFFDVPGLWGGEQPFPEWALDFIDTMKSSRVSLVFLVMTKTDRLDEPTKASWAVVKDLFKAISPKAVVLTVTRCEKELTVDDE